MGAGLSAIFLLTHSLAHVTREPDSRWTDRDRNHLYVKDTQGKTHKLPLLKTTRKEAEPPR